MDFGSGAEGSAQNLAKLIRPFVAAGIANRVLAIADNNTAAYDPLDSLTPPSSPSPRPEPRQRPPIRPGPGSPTISDGPTPRA